MAKKVIKPVAQMTCTKGELLAIRLVVATDKFESTSEYIRSLVTADVIARKKANPELAWRYGEGYNDWANLDDDEKVKYLNQLGPVQPRSFEHFMKNLN